MTKWKKLHCRNSDKKKCFFFLSKINEATILDFCSTISEKSSFDLRLAWVGAKCYHLRCYKQITPIPQIIVFLRDWSLLTGRGATKQEWGVEGK